MVLLRSILFSPIVFISLLCFSQKGSFTNPLLPSGADPWSIYKDGFYYYTHTMGNRLVMSHRQGNPIQKDCGHPNFIL
jgi:hypothetical protein